MKIYKICNVDLSDIVWCDETYTYIDNIKKSIENYTISISTNSTTDEMIQEILAQIEADTYNEFKQHNEFKHHLYIASAKIKVNNELFFVNTFDGI